MDTILTMKMNKESLLRLFREMDQQAGGLLGEEAPLDLVVMGSAVLILQDMPDRLTIDVDFWRTTPETRQGLSSLFKLLNVDFDPVDYRHRDKPYVQWVSPGFVHMPVEESWRDEAKVLWRGNYLVVKHPPVGVMLASKLAAWREQDVEDVRYIVQSYPDWKESLERWVRCFSEEHQEVIRDNMVFTELFEKEAPVLRGEKSPVRGPRR